MAYGKIRTSRLVFLCNSSHWHSLKWLPGSAGLLSMAAGLCRTVKFECPSDPAVLWLPGSAGLFRLLHSVSLYNRPGSTVLPENDQDPQDVNRDPIDDLPPALALLFLASRNNWRVRVLRNGKGYWQYIPSSSSYTDILFHRVEDTVNITLPLSLPPPSVPLTDVLR